MKKCMIRCLVFFLLFVGIGYLFFGGDTDALIGELIEQGETMDVLVTYDENNKQECDGLGVTHVPFGQVISTCGKSWLVMFWGEVITLKDDGGISGRISQVLEQDFQPVFIDHQVMNFPFHEAQAGSVYQLGDLLFVFVLQKNMNTPLLNLPFDVETEWGGVLVSGDQGAHWQSFLMYQNPMTEGGLVLRHNPVGMYVKQDQLFIDVSDAAGAGSGEGQLTRFTLSDDYKDWLVEGCYYLVPEVYEQEDGQWMLEASEYCLLSLENF